MRIRAIPTTWRAAFFGLGLVCLGTTPAAATDHTWAFSGLCLFPGCNWSAPGYWSPNGIPGSGDTATIDRSIRVVLSDNIGALDGMTLSSSARVHTRGYSLSVASSGANTFLFGTGVGNTGGNTQLVVDDGAYLGLDFLAYFFSMHQGAELRMNGGGAIASFGINVSASSLISGHGIVVLLDSGTRFDIAGHVRPSGGDLVLWSQAHGRLDLDGNVGGDEPGQIRVTENGNLRIQGSLADPFSGTMEIGARNDVEFDTPVEIDGQVLFSSSFGNDLIAPSIVFGSGAEVIVDGAIGSIVAESSWPLDATIDLVAPTDELHLVGDASFAATTTWLGDGLLVNEWPGTMTLADGSDVLVDLSNAGTLEVGDPIGLVVLSDLEQTGGLAFDLEGTTPGVDFDQIRVAGDLALAGDLEVRVAAGVSFSQGDAFPIIAVDGASAGAFDGYAEGDYFDTLGGQELYLTYSGGDGNDVVLYTLPEPSTAAALAIGALSLGVASRRRDRALVGRRV